MRFARIRTLWLPSLALLCPFALCAADAQLTGKVVDENGVAVAGAGITLRGEESASLAATTTDEAGRFSLASVDAGTYELRVEKLGFYAYVSRAFELRDDDRPLEIVLNHQREFEETVNVEYSAPVIDRQEVAAQKSLQAEEIVEIPYPASHDFRSALPLLPGVIKDNAGKIHLNGGAENQASYSLDGFNIANPVSGTMQNRISVDAIRAVQVESSRFSAEFGKGSSGVMALETLQGDDRFRFMATNFFPSFEIHETLGISAWTPRATVSGPILKGRAWFFNAIDLQYDLNIIDQLPSSANTNRNWHGGNLTRFQVNLSPRNILTSGVLFNFTNSRHYGITPHDPVESSRDIHSRFYFFNLKDQAYLEGGWVFEAGIAANSLRARERPLGSATYVISPEQRSGNYFRESEEDVERIQALANILVRPLSWRGRHDLKFGIDANRIRYRQHSYRRSFEVRREDNVRARAVDFEGDPDFGRDNSEFSAYIQERWAPGERLLLEAGVRLDWDQVLRDTLVSPRFAFTFAPNRIPESKFSAGVGVYYDALNLNLLTRSLDQIRSDTWYDADGATVRDGPVVSRYAADERALDAPFHLNWSLAWEQKLPGAVYFVTSFIRRHGRDGWAYKMVDDGAGPGGRTVTYELANERRDSYYYLEFTARRVFKEKYTSFVSYARSSARSTAVIDFSLENAVFSSQGSGPLDWDAPNRLVAWGTVPAPHFKSFSLAYFLEWRSGLPFSLVNEEQELVGPPNSQRFPDYFNLNLHVERRFRFWRSEWALRVGFNNITGHQNPSVVVNNIDSPLYGQFAGGSGQVFTGRIRFLGKN
jgi:hypothetical protein